MFFVSRSRHVIWGSFVTVLALSFLNFESFTGQQRNIFGVNSAAGDIAFYREDPATKEVIPVKFSKRNLVAKVPTSKEKGKFVITFLGDTLVVSLHELMIVAARFVPRLWLILIFIKRRPIMPTTLSLPSGVTEDLWTRDSMA